MDGRLERLSKKSHETGRPPSGVISVGRFGQGVGAGLKLGAR